MSRIEDAIERYESLIEEKDTHISDLEEQVEQLEYWANERSWSRHRKGEDLNLPVPRLQIELKVVSEFKYNWFYSLVYTHTTGDIVLVPMGETTTSGTFKHFKVETAEDAMRELPFRDGVHIRRDSYQLSLPAFALINGISYPLDSITD